MLLASLQTIFDLRRIVFVVGMVSWSLLSMSQASVPMLGTTTHTNQAVLTACVAKLNDACSSTPKISLSADVAKSVSLTKKSRAKLTTLPACLTTSNSYYAYQASTSQAMTTLNSNADSLRSQAISSGEGYQSFELQMNSLFASYDMKVDKLFQTYLSQNKMCEPVAKAPVIFQMFP
jgi:hypothetical protein